ncbi:MAG: hypothetical protein PHE24_06305 [Patescibacteria group bacterium]|nr:hypothetical protein [Patescibacteria group bacterium]
MPGSYWDQTDRYLKENGKGPDCPTCHEEMVPADDHGRFTCISCGGNFDAVLGMPLSAPRIPQIDTSRFSDEEKAKIPAIHRLRDIPTAAERNVLSFLLRGPEAMNEPGYDAARQALQKEQNR